MRNETHTTTLVTLNHKLLPLKTIVAFLKGEFLQLFQMPLTDKAVFLLNVYNCHPTCTYCRLSLQDDHYFLRAGKRVKILAIDNHTYATDAVHRDEVQNTGVF